MVEITDVVPKAYYDDDMEAYYLSIKACVTLLVNTTATNLELAIIATVDDPHIFIDKVRTLGCLFSYIFCFEL